MGIALLLESTGAEGLTMPREWGEYRRKVNELIKFFNSHGYRILNSDTVFQEGEPFGKTFEEVNELPNQIVVTGGLVDACLLNDIERIVGFKGIQSYREGRRKELNLYFPLDVIIPLSDYSHAYIENNYTSYVEVAYGGKAILFRPKYVVRSDGMVRGQKEATNVYELPAYNEDIANGYSYARFIYSGLGFYERLGIPRNEIKERGKSKLEVNIHLFNSTRELLGHLYQLSPVALPFRV